MEIESMGDLDSVAREAGRQAAYYRGRDPRLNELWRGIAQQALLCLTNNTVLMIREKEPSPNPIIKPREQRFDGIIPLPPQ